MRKTIIFLIFLLVAYAIGVIYLFTVPISYSKISNKPIETPAGPIGATFYEPTFNTRSDFVVIIIHGWSASRTYMHALALDVVRLGFKVVSIDQLGHQGSVEPMYLNASIKDIRVMAVKSLEEELKISDSIIRAAKDFVGNESAKIILIGHSLGGALSIMIGFTHPDVEAVFALGPLPPMNT